MNETVVAVCGWICGTIMACTLIVGVTYYNLETPSRLEIQERMFKEQGLHPLTFRCMNMDLGYTANFEMCRILVKQLKLTPEQEERFREFLETQESIER